MPDPTPLPVPAATPKRTRAVINKEHLAEVKTSRKVAKNAVAAKYAAPLAAVELDPALVPRVNVLCDELEAGFSRLKSKRKAGKVLTKQETAAREALLAALGPIQTAAKRKFLGEDATLRENYGIGEPLGTATLLEVLTAARAALARLVPGPNAAPPADVLPGVKADGAIKLLADAITLYGGKDTAQGQAQEDAGGELEEIEAKVTELAAKRHAVQLAADQAFPWRAAKSGTPRRAFELPLDQPLGV